MSDRVNLTARRAAVLGQPVWRVLWELSWPTSIGLLAVIAFSIVDVFYIGQLGPMPLAAMGFCFPVIFGLSAIAVGMGNGAAALVAIAVGAGDFVRARTLIFSASVLVTLYALALTILMLMIDDALFRLIGVPDSLLGLVSGYMQVWFLGLPFIILPIALNALVRAVGDARVSSVLMLGAAAVNAVISPVLIFGGLGFPGLGMDGGAWAALIARALMTLACIAYLARLRLFAPEPNFVRNWWGQARAISAYGAPAFLAQLVAPVTGGIVTRLLSAEGPDAVAAFAVGARIEALLLVPFFGLQAGISPFIGQTIGAGITARLAQAQRVVRICALGWGALAGLLLFGFGRDVAAAFTSDVDVLGLADQYMNLLALGFWGAGFLLVGTGIFVPLGYPYLGMGLSIARYLLGYAGLATVLALVLPEAWRISGIFCAAPLSYALAGLASAAFVGRRLSAPRDATGRTEGGRTPSAAPSDLPPSPHP